MAKAIGRALSTATRFEPRRSGQLPTTKEVLG
jgi:imidazoleglycerol phosphate dehydratase HisB